MSASAIQLPRSRPAGLWGTTNGKKAVMAVTGVVLYGFVFVHMAGNLQIFLGAQAFNHYAETLKAALPLLWGARTVLLLAVALHIVSAVALYRVKAAARPIGYVKQKPQVSTYASRTMYMSGPILAAFLVYHLLHFTLGQGGTPFDALDPYWNVVHGFQFPLVAGFYVLSMALLCMHLYHGVWSGFQSVGINHPRYTPLLRIFAKGFSLVVFLGFVSVPVGVLTGLVK